MPDALIQQDALKCAIFFKAIFGETDGVLCIGFKARGTDSFKETFFEYPSRADDAAGYAMKMAELGDVYFCTQILSRNRRLKEDVKVCPNVWVDLDFCEPRHLDIPPSMTVETSPGRYQGFWILDPPVEPLVAEDISKRLTYNFVEFGSDKNGWCLTKYMRVPFTFNYKYPTGATPMVKIIDSNAKTYKVEHFAHYPPAKDLIESAFPFPRELPGEADEILIAKRSDIHPLVYDLFYKVPEQGKWSSRLWNLEILLVEGGLLKEEIFVIAKAAACNKYERDNRPEIELWREVCKAWGAKYVPADTLPAEMDEIGEISIVVNNLLTEDERTWVRSTPTVVEEYIRWAATLSDASWQYHEAGIFTILSSILCGNIRLPTSAATLNLNLWFMILANTTLTRKTTAMGIANGVLDELDPDVLLATDGSPEGLMSALSTRTGQPSMFLRDEVSGLLDSMRKDYMAGLGEVFAKLYDGNRERRQLRKEVIDIRDPRLILFTGGVKNRVFELLDNSHVLSGFLPRFIFVTAEPIMKNLRPMGPPTVQALGERAEIVKRLAAIRTHYVDQMIPVVVNGNTVGQTKRIWDATLTEEAWYKFNKYSDNMIDEAMKSIYRELLVPTFDRLTKSGLKVATLLAAARKLEDTVVVEVEDLIRAFYYVERWRRYALEVIENLGKNPFEKMVEQIEAVVAREPGTTKSKIMRTFHLTSKAADETLGTMFQRGLIKREAFGAQGKFERLFPVNYKEKENGRAVHANNGQ